MDMIHVGRFIAQRRRELGYTQEELGRHLQVTDKAISKWERGVCCPDVSLLGSLAAELKISIAELLQGAQSKKAESSLRQGGEEDVVDSEELTIRPGRGSVVSPYLFGSNMEHTRSNVMAGISAQMLKNRKFAGKPEPNGCAALWYSVGKRTMFFLSVEDAYTRHAADHYHMNRNHECNGLRIVNFHTGQESGIGQHEICWQKEREYLCSITAKSSSPVTLTVSFTDRWGNHTYVSAEMLVDSGEWKTYTVLVECPAENDDGDLRITFSEEGCIWLGAVSLLPADHFHGMRRDVIAALKEMGVKVLRWPGGNFAGEYNWFDGLLPVDMRAPLESALGLETQPYSMGYDFHEINTDDFIALCREIGAEPFLTINPAWNTPEESAAWVEYCNGDEKTVYGRLRAERGYPQPYAVQLWSLGNEFGYGHMEGDNTPQGYAGIVREHANAMKKVCGTLTFCSSGPYPDPEWVRHAAVPLSDIAPLTSLHYYAPGRMYDDRDTLRTDYLNCIASPEIARERIRRFREQAGNGVQISFDEWNTWYAWYCPSCVTDGIFTALMLTMFIGEAERGGIALVCHFEACNEGAMTVTPGSVALTATGQVFSVMKRHINGSLLFASRTDVITEMGDVVTVTAVNPSYDHPKHERIAVNGTILEAVLYLGRDVLPYSVFECVEAETVVEDDGWTVEIPPHSMILVQIQKDRSE